MIDLTLIWNIMEKVSALALADYILGKYPDKNITPMKLQKLAYYSKVWVLVAGKPVMSAQFVKWERGPVNAQIYSQYKKYSGNIIREKADANVVSNEELDELLTFILDNHINLSVAELSAMAHSEDPWIKTPEGTVISDEMIIEYYSEQPFAKNFQKASFKQGPFHLLQDENWHSFTLDMDADEAKSFASYSSYEEYLGLSQKVKPESCEFFKDVFT